MRDDSARPSGSRTVGWAMTSVGIARSRAICRITRSCCASFWPKYARSAPTRLNRIATTVATPSKWPGPGGALERLGDGADAHGRVEARRVDLLDRRREHEVGALLGADLDVARLVARVLLEVRRVAELARVDEDRDDGRRVLGARPLDQRSMALVQPAHRRHEADRARGGGERLAELRARPDDARRRGVGSGG